MYKGLFFNLIVVLGLFLMMGGTPTNVMAAEADQYVTIGTGGLAGTYYPTGGAICRLVNKNRSDHGIRCSVESTGGSIANLNLLSGGEVDMGVAQSDLQYFAYKGINKFENMQNKDLRAVFSIYPEPFTIVARADAGITHFEDLKGKRVNIGSPGSGMRGTMEMLMERYGWTKDDFKLAAELVTAECAKALCDNKIDAYVMAVGHPASGVEEATTTCDAKLVNVDGALIEEIVEKQPYYMWATVPGGMYRGNPDDTTTFGVGATFVSTADVSEDVIYHVVKSVFENFETFRQLHPAFKELKKEDMVKEGLSAPLHRGAIKYYKEAGLM